MKELWRDVVSFNGAYVGKYEVSNTGLVRASTSAKGRGIKPGRVLYQSKDDKGYPQCQLYMDMKATTVKIHRLVAESFLGERPSGHTVNHIDGVKSNNRISNLEYVTNKENLWHAHRVISTRSGLEISGEKMSITEAIHRYGAAGVTRARVDARIRRHGWSAYKALTIPVGSTGRPTNKERLKRGTHQ